MSEIRTQDGGGEADLHGWGTVPNVITLVRLLVCVPLIAWLVLGTELRLVAAVALVVFGLTDWVDGFIARRTHTVSDVGIWLDPLADRMGIVAILVTMTLTGLIPWWLVAVIVAVDAAVFVVGMRWRTRIGQLRASWVGKSRTALLMIALPAFLLGDSTVPGASAFALIGLVCFAVGTLLHVLAGVGYMLRLAGRRGSELRSGTPVF